MTSDNNLPNIPDPTGAPPDVLADNIAKLERVQTQKGFGVGEIPTPVPASDVREQYIGDTDRISPDIVTNQIDFEAPVLEPLTDPETPQSKGEELAMWECYITDYDARTARVNAGVIQFPIYVQDPDVVNSAYTYKTIPIEFEGGDVPAGGDYIYAAIPVNEVDGERGKYLEYTGGGITLMVDTNAPDALEDVPGSLYVPIAKFERTDTTDEAGATVPATMVIKQYLEGSPVVDAALHTNLPVGTTHGDMLYWNSISNTWEVIAAPVGATVLQVLSFNPLALLPVPEWIDTYDCP